MSAENHFSAENIAREMAKGLNWQEAFNRCGVAFADHTLSQIEWYDYREREALKDFGPGNWRDWAPEDLDAKGHQDRVEIMRAALLNLISTGGLAFIGETSMQLSKLMVSTLDPITLARQAVNTERKGITYRRQRDRDRGTMLGDGWEFVPDDIANTEQDALWARAASSLTELELGLCSLLLQGHSLRDIEAGTEKAGGKVDRRELARMMRGIEKKLRAAGVTRESTWRPKLPYSARFNPGGKMHEKPKDPNDNYKNAPSGTYDDRLQIAQRARNRMLDRDARRRRPATEAELQECRDAMAAVDARVGSDDVGTGLARVVPGALSKHYKLLDQIDRERKPPSGEEEA